MVMVVFCVRAIFLLLLLREVGRIRCGRVWFPDKLFAMSLGESRIRQTGPRSEKRGRSRVGFAGVVDGRHGGPALFAMRTMRTAVDGRGSGRCGGTARGTVPFSILG